MSKERPTMAEMPYHFGLKMKCFPSTKQKQMIRKGIDATRFTYNEMVARNQDLYDVRTTIMGMIAPYFAFRRREWVWVQFHNRNRESNVVLDYLYQHMTPLNCLVKFQMMGGWLNPDERFKKKYKAKYGEYYTGFFNSMIETAKTIKERFDWLDSKLIAAATLGMAMRAYNDAWNLWRKAHNNKVGTPRFKRKDWFGTGSMRLTTSYLNNAPLTMFDGTARVLDKNHLFLPQLGRIRVAHLAHFLRKHDCNVIRIGTVTVRQDNIGQYWISLALGSMSKFTQLAPKTNKVVGIDLNTSDFYMDSNGNEIPNPRFYRNAEKYLNKAKRVMSRRQLRAKKENRSLRNSKNYLKQRLLVAKKMKRIANQRNSFLDNLSITLIKNHDLVVAENLQSKNMLKNHALAKSIADVGWRTFIQKLTYKAELYGKTFITINPAYTTQTCFDCGYVMGRDDQSERLVLQNREWTCPNCGEHHIRDWNAAKNILRKGQLALAE